MLITPEKISTISFNGSDITLSKYRDSIERVIQGVIAQVETYINRPLSHGLYVQVNPTPDTDIIPVVSPVTNCEVAEKFTSKRITLSTAKDEVEYEAGYTPETLPDDIIQVVSRLVSYEINQASNNTHGLVTKSQTIGGNNISVQRDSESFVTDELKRLEKYKNKQYYSYVERIN